MKREAGRVEILRKALALVCPPDKLQIGEIEVYRGPNPCSPQPAIRFSLQPGPDVPEARKLGERLVDYFPDLALEPRTTPPARKAKLESLASTVARLAAALLIEALRTDLNAGPSAKSVKSEAWFEYLQEASGLQALKAALVAVGSRISGSDTAMAMAEAATVNAMVEHYGPNPEAVLMIAAARKRDIPFLQIAENHALWQFGWGRRSQHFWVTSSNADGMVAHRLSTDKEVAKRLMRQLGIPTPAHALVLPGEDLSRAARRIGWPCVVKPRSGGSGTGVTTGIHDSAMLGQAVELARKRHAHVLIEAHVPGEDHRLMVVDGRLIAAIRREWPFVTGDGRSPIGALIDTFNAPRQGDKRSTGYLSPVPRDSALALTLAGQDMTLESVPAAGEKILLRSNANRSTGGTPIDVLDQVHPQVRFMAEELAGAFGFRATGIDYITTDISRSPEDVRGAVIELNITPGLDVLLAAGMDKDAVAALILGSRPSRIPVRLLLASSEARAEIEPALRRKLAGTVGAASEQWSQLGDLALPASELDPVERAQLLLRYPTMDAAVIVWSVDTLCQHGLPVDKLAEVLIIGPPPPADWLAVLKKNAKSLTMDLDVSTAVAALLDGSGRDVADADAPEPG